MIVYRDTKFGFIELFNENNGFLIRGDVNGIDPTMRSFPELLDVGIMGHCHHTAICRNAGIDCYQNGEQRKEPHMSVSDFEIIARQASGKTFQIALGGAGDPNKHPYFKDILEISRYYQIVPNLTTSGVGITDMEIEQIKQHCGAVAVSWYSRLINGVETNQLTVSVNKRLVDAGCTTNIHFVVSTETIDEAIIRLEKDLFPDGINAVIFILYKPVGRGKTEKTLSPDDPRIKVLIDNAQTVHPYRIGFDTCFSSAILRYGNTIADVSVDACEAGAFSMYIDSQMNCFPCSFGIWETAVFGSLRDKTIREVWESDAFCSFRKMKKNKCNGCEWFTSCQGGCRIGLNIDLCGKSS